MLLTIETTYRPATDLGYLLHKNPARIQEFELSAGRAVVFYPQATPEGCTAALLVEIDPIALVRGRVGAREGGLARSVVAFPVRHVVTGELSLAQGRGRQALALKAGTVREHADRLAGDQRELIAVATDGRTDVDQ